MARGDKILCPDVRSWASPLCEPTNHDLIAAFERLGINEVSAAATPSLTVVHHVSRQYAANFHSFIILIAASARVSLEDFDATVRG